MASTVLIGGKGPIPLVGKLPEVGAAAPASTLTDPKLADVSVTADDFKGKAKILNIFPSVDTAVCATSVRKFNKEASALPNAVVLCISADLPFAQARFCGAEGLKNVVTLSSFRSDFGTKYGVELAAGPMKGLLSRAIVVVDAHDKVTYTELVPDVTSEPNYAAALDAVKKH